MCSIPTITYIKNGQEKTITVTKKNQRTIKKEIYKVIKQIDFYNYQINSTYIVNDDIELVHFQNMTFSQTESIKTSTNTLCILEDCSFGNPTNQFNEFEFLDGTFELINPVLNHNDIGNIRIISNTDVNVIYTNKLSTNQTLELNDISTNNNTTLKINAIKSLRQLIINFYNINIENNLKLIRLRITGNNITIGNPQNVTTIELTGQLPNEILATEKIKLTNCNIKSLNEQQLAIISPQIEVKNINLRAKDKIQLKNTCFYKKSDEPMLNIDDKDIARANLISSLKGYKQLLDEIIKKQSTIFLKDTIEYQNLQIEKQEHQIKEQLLKLEQLKQQLKDEVTKKEQSITKNLSKKPAKYFGQSK